MIIDYQVVQAITVNNWLMKGYQPLGGPVYNGAIINQAVVLEDSGLPLQHDLQKQARAASVEALIRTGEPEIQALVDLIASNKADIDAAIIAMPSQLPAPRVV